MTSAGRRRETLQVKGATGRPPGCPRGGWESAEAHGRDLRMSEAPRGLENLIKRFSQPWYHCSFGPDNSCCGGLSCV